jgi:hypothetical protein
MDKSVNSRFFCIVTMALLKKVLLPVFNFSSYRNTGPSLHPCDPDFSRAMDCDWFDHTHKNTPINALLRGQSCCNTHDDDGPTHGVFAKSSIEPPQDW